MPEMGINDVLIKIKKTAICGTDVHIYEWNAWAQEEIKPPLTIGHEYVGEVVDVGSNVKSVKVGERVSGEGHIVCGHCRNCRAGQRHLCRETRGVGVNRDGAFAEYLCIPETNVWHCDPSIDDELYAIFDRSATRRTRRSASTWSARTCSSRARAPSASWRRASPSTSARATSSSWT